MLRVVLRRRWRWEPLAAFEEALPVVCFAQRPGGVYASSGLNRRGLATAASGELDGDRSAGGSSTSGGLSRSAFAALAVVGVAAASAAAYWSVATPDGALPQAPGATADTRLRLRVGSRGRGLFLSAPVEAGTVLISVKTSAVISPHRAQRLLLGDARRVDSALTGALLPALLAKLRTEADVGTKDLLGWRPYVLQLPEAFHALPLTLPPVDVERELRGTALGAAAARQRAFCLAQRDAFRQAFPEAGPPGMWDDSRWLWACALLLTRGGLGLNFPPEALSNEDGIDDPYVPTTAIVPLLDFANCELEDPTCDVRLGKEGEVELVARRPLTTEDEVTFSYGRRSREQTLFTFGYWPETGEVAASSPLPLSHDEGGLRNALLRLLALGPASEEGSETDNGVDPQAPRMAQLRRQQDGRTVDASELVAAANVMEMTEAELKRVAAQAAAAKAFPIETFGEKPSRRARERLNKLFQAWFLELMVPADDGKTPVSKDHPFAALRAYREGCVALVTDAMNQLRIV